MCWDANVTVKNNGTAARKRVVIDLEFTPPRNVFPEVKGWYHGVQGTPIKLTPDGRKWKVEFEIVVPPGGSVHVGWDFKDNVEFGTGGYRFVAQAPKQAEKHMGAVALSIRKSQLATSSPLLVALNPSDSPGAVVITRLQVAAHTSRLPLDSLIAGDALLESLEWRDFGRAKYPINVKPGSPALSFDSPREVLAGQKVGLARSVVSDPKREFIVESFFQCPATILRRRALRSKPAAKRKKTTR